MAMNLNASNHVPAVEALTCRRDSRPVSGTYDEMWLPDGSIRPHWRTFFDALRGLSCEELQRRQGEALLFLKENGSTYNINGELNGVRRQETLDPIPFIVSREDWRDIETAVRQRMRLLTGIFHDLYGRSALLREGVVAPSIVYGNRDFLHPCFHEGEETTPSLPFCAFDVGRDAGGGWRILRHSARIPEGLGYALQDRTAMARVFPEVIRNCKVYRLSHFFRSFRMRLSNLLPERGRDPRIVILTPGPGAEAYFEHAYLSSYLGYPLVQGDDLTVRDAAVWLKSIDGLERVDVILRFVDDVLCDPLELASRSGSGIPGLMEAVRRGSVSIANPLGAGLLDSLAVSAHLPRLCRRLLQEDLLLPGPSAWWGGNPEARERLLDAFETYHWTELSQGGEIHFPYWDKMKNEDRARLKNRFLVSPESFIGVEKVALASAPSLEGLTLVPRRTVLRIFVSAHQEDFLVMPGGVARHPVSSWYDVGKRSLDAGGKDVWVLAAEPQKHVSLWLSPERMEEELRSSSILTSRAAENLFWVGRYSERAEGLARLLRTVLHHYAKSSHSEDGSERECLNCLLRSLTHITCTFPGFVGGGQPLLHSPEYEILADIRDITRTGSLASTVASIIRAAYAVRERWSKDTWRVLEEIDGKGSELQRMKPGGMRTLQQDLDYLITSLMAFAGLGMESMIREQGWLLLDMGRRIERALQLVELFLSLLVERHDADGVLEHLVLESALITTESIISYRRRYRSYLQIVTVVELLLLDATNPRSLGYQLNRLQEHIAGLPRDRAAYRLDEDERAVLEVSSLVRLADPKRLTQPDDPERYVHLEEVLTRVKDLLASTSVVLSKSYFSHVQKSRQLAPGGIEEV